MTVAGPELALGSHESRMLPIAALLEPPLPSRSQMDEEKLEELAASMRTLGVLQHLIVVETRGQFEIIAGHRRYHAAVRAGLAAVPCDVYPDREHANEAVQHAENRFREDLSVADEAVWFDELLERKFGGDTDRLAAYLGEKRAYVEGRLALFKGDRAVFQALADGKITFGVAHQLNRCDAADHRAMLLYQAVHGGATIAVVSGWIAEYLQVHKPANANQPAPAPAAATHPVLESNYFTCCLCGKSESVHAMQPINMHTYCRQAMLADMLALWNHRHEYYRFPRNSDDAATLINDLAERYPEILREPTPQTGGS